MRNERFVFKRAGSSSPINCALSIILLIIVLTLYSYGLDVVDARQNERAITILSEAIDRDIVRCYASEGMYPESLDYLIDHYGLIYDKDRFYVDYHAQGSNILPEVTIIDRSK